MPSKYQTDQYSTHSTITTQFNKSDQNTIMWPDNLSTQTDLILSNTALPCPTHLHQSLSLRSRTLSPYMTYICLVSSYHYQIQIQILFNNVSTQTYTWAVREVRGIWS